MPQPEISLAYNNFTAARVNPLGLIDFFRLTLQLRMFESESALLTQNFIGFGFSGAITPALGKAGGIIEIQPLTVLRLWARYMFVGYFGTFDLLASFEDAESNFRDSNLSDPEPDPVTGNTPTTGLATSGSELTLGADFRLKLGPVAVRNFTRLYRADMDLPSGETVFYDQLYDMLMPDEGWMLTNELDGLYVTDFGMIVGARWTYAKPFYEERQSRRSSPRNNDLHRVGPLIAYVFEKNLGSRFERPTLLLLAQWHIEHQYRTGEDVSQAVPYLGLAFQFTGNLLADE